MLYCNVFVLSSISNNSVNHNVLQWKMYCRPCVKQFLCIDLFNILALSEQFFSSSLQGYSSLAVALALPESGHLVACERDKRCLEVAKKYYQRAGVAHKVILLTYDSLIDPSFQTSITTTTTTTTTTTQPFVPSELGQARDETQKTQRSQFRYVDSQSPSAPIQS